ncbi:MAG: LacI family DNA-binding transcriptional regulator [Chthoniobacteraceae bacterium]|nr:LacI family DNA-binding transcriptional regulator [Chthoniobacteraceae bacterium]
MNPENVDAPRGGAAGESRPEGKAITMAMIAKAAGVSQGAISSLLNDRDYGIRVSAKTRERVFRVCREMGYIPNDLRAVVRMYPEQGEFALLVSQDMGMENPFADALSKALLRQIPVHHLSLAWYDPALDYAAHPGDLPEPLKTGVASKFITLGTPNGSLFSAIVAREAPGVHIGQEAGVAGYTSIVPEYARASRQAVDALLALGHHRIAILSGPFGSTDPVIIELNYGVRAAYDALKIPIEAQNVIYGNPTFEHGVASADLLLERPQKPTAVFCFSPLAAAGVLHRAQARGLHVPEDLSVIAFGEADFCPLLHPPLATVSLSAEETARKTIEDLSARIRAQDTASTRRITLPCALAERNSLARPKEH